MPATHPRALIATLAATGAVLALGLLAPGAAPASAADPTLPPSPASMVGKLTGPGALTDTVTEWGVEGTDLGIFWDGGNGRTFAALGDTFGDWSGDGGGGGEWRSNVLLGSSDTDPSDGITFDWAATGEDGTAREIVPSKKISGDEMTTIPTAGIAVDGVQYMAYMSVRQWGEPGQWQTNYARIAYSTDDGETWNHTDGPTWENTDDYTHPFQMMAFAQRDDGDIYMYGTPNGRTGQMHVARVAPEDILDKGAYEYWTADGWQTDAELDAVPLFTGNASEAGVHYNTHTGRWVMLYLQDYDGIVLRTAESPEGPWSEATVVVHPGDYPQLYGGFIHPASNGPDIYFAMSEWRTYNVYLMKVTLRPDGTVTHPNLIEDPSFERQSGLLAAPWAATGQAGIDTMGDGNAFQYSGAKSVWMRFNSGWIDVHQTVQVEPGTEYELAGFVRTGGATDEGYLGVRVPGGDPIAEIGFTDLGPDHERLTTTFSSGEHTELEVVVGTWTDAGDRWVQADALSLTSVAEIPALQPWDLQLGAEPASGTELGEGDVVEYTGTITHPGTGPDVRVPWASVTQDLDDVLDDAEMLPDSVTASSGELTVADGAAVWSGALEPGTVVTYSFAARVLPDGDRGDSTLTTTATGTAPGGTLAACATEDCRTVAHTVADAPPKPFTITVDSELLTDDEPSALDRVRYEVTATNMDDERDLDELEVRLLGAGLFDDAYLDVPTMRPAGDVVVVGEDAVWTGPLAAGASATFTLEVVIAPDGARGDDSLVARVTGTAEDGELRACTPAGCDVSALAIAVDGDSDGGGSDGGGSGGGDDGGSGDDGGTDGAGGSTDGATDPTGGSGGAGGPLPTTGTGSPLPWVVLATLLTATGALMVARHRRTAA